MKKLFSLLILVALLATLTILVACKQETTVNSPVDEDVHIHRFNNPKTYEPTCDVEGYTERKCLDCGYYYRYDIKPIDPNNHVYYNDSKGKFVDAYEKNLEQSYTAKDCSERSFTVWVCKECGKEKKVDGSIGAHDFLEGNQPGELNVPDEILLPTCTTPGKNTYYCQVPGCTEKKIISIPNAGHLWGDWIVDEAPTCSLTHVSDGERHRVCDNCPEEQHEVILPHTSATAGVKVDPTCTTVGYTLYVCDECGIEYKRDFRDPAPHEYTFLYELEGKFYYVCGCGHSITTDKKMEK